MQGIIGDVWDCIPHPAPNNHSTEICESLLSACPVFCCRSLRKLFLPDSLRRSGFPWCALVLAALHRKVILACSRRFCCQGTLVFNLRIGESPFRKVLSKSLQIFCKIHVNFFTFPQNKRGRLQTDSLFPIYFTTKKYSSTRIPSTIRYQPNTLKSCFLM